MQFMKRRSGICLLLLLLVLACGTSAFPQRSRTTPTRIVRTVNVTAASGTAPAHLTAAQQRRQDAFMRVWTILDQTYFDRTYNGLDWPRIRDEYQPKITAAITDAEAHRLMQEMILRLGRSHFAIVSPEFFENVNAARTASRARERITSTHDGPASGSDDPDDMVNAEHLFIDPGARFGIGIDLRYIDKRFVVASVAEHSSAQLVGIRQGYVVEKINGLALDDLVSRTVRAYPNSREIRQVLPLAIVNWFLNSKDKTPVALTCLDEKDESREFSVPRLALAGRAVSFGGSFPLEYLEYRSSSLSDDVGYIKFNVFALPVLEKFCGSLTDFARKRAIIIDLRGNSGGLLATLYALTGMLTDHPISLGTSIYRRGSEELSIVSKAKHYSGKVVLLVDDQTMSAGEMFSAGLQENGRAVVIGERTAGVALPASIVRLPTGALFEYPVANFKTWKGKILEGTGVEPDVPVTRDRRSLLDGRDAQLEKALEVIKADPAPSKIELSKRAENTSEAVLPPPAKAPAKAQARLTAPALAKQPTSIDPKAIAVMSDFAAAIGGADTYDRLRSYEAVGRGTVGFVGSESDVNLHIFREKPDKYTLLFESDAIGQVRQVYSPKGSFVQTEYGMEHSLSSKPDPADIDLFDGVRDALNPGAFRWLAYDGVFEDEGRKLHVIEARNALGVTMAMTFDVESKMLVRISFPGFMYTLGDFRKVDHLTLPFSIRLDGVMNVQLDSIKLDPTIPPEIFERKLNCFDKPL